MSYVLITPARNEGAHIRLTAESMVSQTVTPLRWVVVSDASTDDTDEIISEYAAKHDWIELLRMSEKSGRDFGAKMRAFNAGLERVKDLDYDVIGNLDADLEFEPIYFEYLLNRFEELPEYGLIGTAYVDVGNEFNSSWTHDAKHVPGACQLFRRKCFEQIGGYIALPTGGLDLLAELRCRYHGWKTQAFTEHVLTHMRPAGTATRSILGSRFNYGYRDYYFGSDPLWQAMRILNQMRHKPVIIGGLYIAAGYLYGHIARQPSPVPPEIRAFRRREQRARIKSMFGAKTSE